jgi:molybdopterin-guanine dinucleotide biosynthesis protein A
MRFVTAPLLAYLIDKIGNAPAVVPRTERGYHPPCAVYSRPCRNAAAERVAAQRLSIAGLLEDVNVRTLERSEMEKFGAVDWLLANVNTPADLQAIEAHLSHQV